MLDLWVSEFGFDNWDEIDDKLAALRDDDFPVDGFVLDLHWCGGVPATGVNPSRMGSLDWDTSHFPSPSQKFADYAAQGIGIIPIEESFIDKGRPEHADLASQEFKWAESIARGYARHHVARALHDGPLRGAGHPALCAEPVSLHTGLSRVPRRRAGRPAAGLLLPERPQCAAAGRPSSFSR